MAGLGGMRKPSRTIGARCFPVRPPKRRGSTGQDTDRQISPAPRPWGIIYVTKQTEAGIDSDALQACVDWVRKELWEWEASDELPSDFARRVVNGVVRLCDAPQCNR